MPEQIDGYRLVGHGPVTKMDAKKNEVVHGVDPSKPMEEQPKPFNPVAEHNEVHKTAIYGGEVR